MTTKKIWESGFTTGSIVGALTAFVGGYGGNKLVPIMLEPHTQNQEYIIEKDPVTQKSGLCDKVIEPVRKDFIKNCNRDNFEQGTILQEISEKKDQVLEQYSCTPQEWQCRPSKPYDLENSEYRVEFRYK